MCAICESDVIPPVYALIREWNLVCLQGLAENKKAHQNGRISDDDFKDLCDFWIGMIIT